MIKEAVLAHVSTDESENSLGKILPETKEALNALNIRADVARSGRMSTNEVYIIVKDDPVAFLKLQSILNTPNAYVSAHEVYMAVLFENQ